MMTVSTGGPPETHPSRRLPGNSGRRGGGASGGWRPGGGQVLFLIGAIGTLAGIGQRMGAPLPFYFGEWMLILLFLATAIAGASLTWRDDHPRTAWSPHRPGRRFQSVVLYTREGCHLCDEVHELLSQYAEYLPEIVSIDIDTDPELQQEYGERVPVVAFNGVPRFNGRVSETMLRRLIDGTTPAEWSQG